MENQEQFSALLKDALEHIREPRLFETERGFQGELLAQLRNRLDGIGLPGAPIVEQEYQKTIPNHGLNIRPDIIVHIPFDRGCAERRNQGNFVAIELKLRSTEDEARADFAKLAQMREVLGYPVTIFINKQADYDKQKRQEGPAKPAYPVKGEACSGRARHLSLRRVLLHTRQRYYSADDGALSVTSVTPRWPGAASERQKVTTGK